MAPQGTTANRLGTSGVEGYEGASSTRPMSESSFPVRANNAFIVVCGLAQECQVRRERDTAKDFQDGAGSKLI